MSEREVRQSNNLTRRQLNLQKVKPWTCDVCGTPEVVYLINYRDPDKPGLGKNGERSIIFPTLSGRSCINCIEPATYAVMHKAGIVGKNEEATDGKV